MSFRLRINATSHTDALYEDWGCEVNPIPKGCLSCPLPACKYDDPNWRRKAKIIERHNQMLVYKREGYSIKTIAHLFGLSTRQLKRVRMQYRKLGLSADG